MEAQKKLMDTIRADTSISGLGGTVGDAIAALDETDPFFAITGMGLSAIFSFFSPKNQELEYEEHIQEELTAIFNRLNDIEDDMNTFFKQTLDEVKQETCKSRYATAEGKIKNAMLRLNTYYNNRHDKHAKKTAEFVFLQECKNNACADAASMIFSSIDGDSGLFGCDMMQILMEGDPSGRWLSGY